MYGNLLVNDVLFMHERSVSYRRSSGKPESESYLVTKTIPSYVSRDPITDIPSQGSSSIQVNHKTLTRKAVLNSGGKSLNDHLLNEFECQIKQHRVQHDLRMRAIINMPQDEYNYFKQEMVAL
jgi:hypothetical protein